MQQRKLQSRTMFVLCEVSILRYTLRWTNSYLTQILNLHLSKLSTGQKSKLIKILIDQSGKGMLVQLRQTLKKLLTSQDDHKNWFSTRVLGYVYPSDYQKCPQNAFFVYFFGPNKFPCQQNYILYLISSPFKMTGWPIFLLMFNQGC